MLRKPPWSVEMLEKVTTSPFRLVMTQLWPFLATPRSEEHTSELQSRLHLVCRLLLEKKKIEHAITEARAPVPPSVPGADEQPCATRLDDRAVPPPDRRVAGAERPVGYQPAPVPPQRV